MLIWRPERIVIGTDSKRRFTAGGSDVICKIGESAGIVLCLMA